MSQANRPGSPRQKMINLMYIVLLALLALNVSSDVLDSFTQVDEGLERSGKGYESRNAALYAALEQQAAVNPAKAADAAQKAADVRRRSAKLIATIDSLKLAIAREADGPEGNPRALTDREDTDAAATVMLSPLTGRGKALRLEVERFRDMVEETVADTAKRRGIAQALSTAPMGTKGAAAPTEWEQACFDGQPAIAAITLLTKLQNDVRYAEGEALAALRDRVGAGDVAVNSLAAFVIPQSQNVMSGSRYSAEIVLAAVDTTARPTVVIDGTKLPEGTSHYETTASTPGRHTIDGYLEVPRPDGTVSRHPFSTYYTVTEPAATVSATMMNVLYAGIDNPLSISVPGIAASGITATMSGGTLTRKGSGWTARPSAPGTPAVITVNAATPDGATRTVGRTEFRVRRLPDPTPYIPLGGDRRYKGSGAIPRQALLNAGGLEAAIDDDILDIPFRVLGFETVTFDSMGNAIAEKSDGSRFSRRQLDSFRRMNRGKRFFISRIRATGPDGTERSLSPIEVTVN